MASQATRLVVEIDGSGAKTGAQVVNDALKSIEASVAAADNARRAFQTNLSKLGGSDITAGVNAVVGAFKSIDSQVAITKRSIASLHDAFNSPIGAIEVFRRAMSGLTVAFREDIDLMRGNLGSLVKGFEIVATSAKGSIDDIRKSLLTMTRSVKLHAGKIETLAKAFDALSVYASRAIWETRGLLVGLKEAVRGSIPAITDLAKAFDIINVHASRAIWETRGTLVGLKEAIRGSIPAITDLANAFTQISTEAKSSVAKVKTIMTDLSTLITTPETSLTSLAAAFTKIGNQKFVALVEAFQAVDAAIKHTKGRVSELIEKFGKVETDAQKHMLEAGRAVIKLGNAFTGKPLQAITLFSNKMLEVGIDATIGMKAATDAVVKLSTAMIPLIRKVANVASKFSLLGKSLEDGLAPALQKLIQFGTAFNHPKEQVLAFKQALAEVGIGAGSGIKTIIAVLRDLADGFSSSILAAKRLRAGLGRIGTAALAGTDKAIVSLYDLGKQARTSAKEVAIIARALRNIGHMALVGTDKAVVSLYDLGKQARTSAKEVAIVARALRNLGKMALVGTDKAIVSMYDLSKQARSSAASVLLLARALKNLGFSAEAGIKAANAAIKSLKTAFTAPSTAITTLKRKLGTIGTKAVAAAKRVDTAMTSMVTSLERPLIHVKVLATAMRNIGTQAAAAAAKVKVAMSGITTDLAAPGKAAKDFAAALKLITGLAFTRFNTSITTLATNTRSLVTAIDALVKSVDKLYASLIKVTAAAELASKAFDKLATAANNATHNMGNTAGAATRSTKAFDALKNAASRMGSAIKTALSPFNLLLKALRAIWTVAKTTAKAILYIGTVALKATVGVAKLAGKLANLATLGIAGKLGNLALKIITLGRASKTAAKDIGVLTKAYRLFRNIYMARLAGGGLSGMQKSIVDARIEWDKMRSTFVAVTGSTAGSRKELEWLRETADDLGSSFTHAAFPFAKLAAAAKGTALEGEGVRKIFEDISVATTTLHMSGDDLKFTFYALQQMISKGSVTMEELRRQLGERIPGAFQDAAKAYAKMKGDITLGTDDLEKAIKAGLVDPIEFLPLLAEEIANRFKDGLMIARVALQAELNRMTTMWFFFKKEVSEGPLDDAWIVFTQTLTEAIERMMPHAKTIGAFLADIVNWAGKWVEILTAHPDAVSDFINLDGWGRLYDYLDKIVAKFISANFPGMSDQITGLGSAFSWLADTVWLLPDMLVLAGHAIAIEVSNWPTVWEDARKLIEAAINLLRVNIEYTFTILMINVKEIVVNGFNDILSYIGNSAGTLSAKLKSEASNAVTNSIGEILSVEGKTFGESMWGVLEAPTKIAGDYIGAQLKKGFANNTLDNIVAVTNALKLETVDASKEVSKAQTSYASTATAAQKELNNAWKETTTLHTNMVGGIVTGAKEIIKAKRAEAEAAREAGAVEYEFKLIDREDTKLELGISSGGNKFEDYEDKKAAAEALIRAAEAKKPPSGGGGGSGASGKTPSQILAEENKLRKEKYDLEHQYLTIMEETYPGIYEMELRGLEADYARTEAKLKMDEALQKGIITEEQHLKALEALEIQYDRTMEAASKYLDTYMEVANILSGAFGDLASAAKDSFGEQSTAYKALFAASKAFAVVEAAIAIQVALAKALTLPPPLNLVEYAKVAALGATIVSTIASASYSGEYDQGGAIPAGSYGMVGEYGPEFVKGPATVTGRGDTAKMIAELVNLMKQREGEGGGSRGGNVRIINAVDPSLMEEYIGSDNGERVVMNVIRRNASSIKQWTQ